SPVFPKRPWLFLSTSLNSVSANLSIFPPFMAYCSALYSWFWSTVAACSGLRRKGFTLFGFFLPSRPELTRLSTSFGVPGLAVHVGALSPLPCSVSPSLLAAFG